MIRLIIEWFTYLRHEMYVKLKPEYFKITDEDFYKETHRW